MQQHLARLDTRLMALRANAQYRTPLAIDGVDFVSNDYLGLRQHRGLQRLRLARLRQASADLGTHASRLLGGHTTAHAALEARLAAWKGCAGALLFSSGYLANLALLGALVLPHDRIISDAQNHASLIDAIRLARCAKVITPHNDLHAVGQALRQPYHGGLTYVVVESLYSMDGDWAPLPELAALCAQHGAALLVDEAHATGLYGPRGSGLVGAHGLQNNVLASVSTFGKALAAPGAVVTGATVVMEALVNFARSFIFTTAAPLASVLLVQSALDVVQAQRWRAARVVRRADQLRRCLSAHGLDTLHSRGPIVPVLLGDNARALQVADAVRVQGFAVHAVRPPTVAANTARLRLSVHANHSVSDIETLAQAIVSAAR